MMKILYRVVAGLLLLVALPVGARGQAVNQAQQVTVAGLRAANGRGGFAGAAYAADGTLYTLYDQGDGVRLLRLNAAGNAVVAQAQIGAAGDAGVALALDPTGNVYVTGTSTSGSLNGSSGSAFPLRADTSTNSFLAKFDSSLRMVFVTFLGAGRTAAAGVAATSDAVFVTGITFSSAFPVTANGIQQAPANGSSENGFVERFSTDGTTLVYATYLTGANGDTIPAAIVADAANNAYIAGATSANGFPTLSALVPRLGVSDATWGFLTKLSATGDGFLFSTFVPGDGVTGLALDAVNSAALLSGNIAPGQFPISAVGAPLAPVGYQSLVRIATDGQSVKSGVILVPGMQSSVSLGANGSAWVSGTQGAPLFPGTSRPLADIGDGFALRVTATDAVDQTVRLGGQPSGSFQYASLSSQVRAAAISPDGATVTFPATLNATVAGSLAATQHFDLPLVNAPNTASPSTLRDVTAPCAATGQCAASAGYLTEVKTASGVSLAVSVDAFPNVVVRNLGSTAATGLVITASGYTVASNCGSTLLPSNACIAALTGSGQGTLTVSAANAPSETFALPANAVTSTGVVVLPRELDFGIVTAVDTAQTRTLTATNLSSAPQTFSSALDAPMRSYTLSEKASDCPRDPSDAKILAAGASCTITLALGPSSVSANDGAIRTAWKVGAQDVTVTAYEQAAALGVSSTSVDFGTQFVNGLRLPRYLFLSNNSSSSIPHATLTLPAGSPFTVTDECPSTLAPHSVCRLALGYPRVTAPAADSLTLTLDQGLTVLVTGQTLPQQGTTASTANPNLSVTPLTLVFGSQVAVTGVSTMTQTVIVKNTGASAVPLTIAVSGDFLITNGCPSILATGSSCQVLVSFAPSQPGVRQGLLAITGGSGFAPAYVTLSGTASGILPSNNGTLDLGQTLVGEPVVAWYKVQQPLSMLTVTSNNTTFGVTIVEDDGSGHGTLPPWAFAQSATGTCSNCYVGVQFLTQTPGLQTGTLTFSTNAKGNTYTLVVTGTALPVSGLLLTPIAYDFGPVAVGSSSAPRLFTLANLLSSGAALNVTSLSATGDFAIATNNSGGASCTGALPASASCFIQVLFAPTTAGLRSGVLTVVTSGGTVEAALSGFGAVDTGVALNPVGLDFRHVPGSSATQQSVVVSNTSAVVETVGAVTSSNAGFTAQSGCGTLAPGAMCVINVTFHVGFAQANGSLAIPVTSTVNGQTTTAIYSVILKGLYTTQDAGLEIVPEEVNFGSVAVGAAGTARQFTLNNLTAKTATVTLSLPRQFPLLSGTACATLAPFGSCTFSIVFLPATAGAATGTVLAQASPTDGSAALETLAYMQGYGVGTGAVALSGNIIPHSPLRFGQVNSGQTAQQIVTLTNTSTSAVTIRRVSSEPPFLATTDCGVTLAAGKSCAVMLTYTPVNEVAAGTAVGVARIDAGTLTIESDADSSPQFLDLAGSAAQVASTSPASAGTLATFSLSESALTFASTRMGEVSAAQSVRVVNTGTTTVHFLSAVVTATPSSIAAVTDFRATTDCATLLPGEACSYSVAFAPTAQPTAGLRAATLELRTDATTALEFVSLLGIASAASVTLNPAALDFGTINVGSQATLPLTVTNSASTPVTFQSVTASGDYTVANGTCPASGGTLPAGASCVIQITFRPTATGTRTGMLSLMTDATSLPLTASLSGNAVSAKLTVTPGALGFGTVAVGAPASLMLTLLNTGTTAVTGIATTVSGTNAADFTVTVPCSTATLAPNQGCTVTVAFAPSAVGARGAVLSIASSDPASPIAVTLTGTGSAPGSFTLTVNGGSSAAQTVKSGSPANYTLTVTPVSGFTGVVALTCGPVTPGVYASCSLSPSTVTLSSGAQTSLVSINTITSARNERSSPLRDGATVFLAWVWLPLLCMRRRKAVRLSLSVLLFAPIAGLLLGAALVGCGGSGGGSTGGGNGGLRYTPAGTYQYQVTASSTSGPQITQSVTLNLTVQ